MRSKKGKSRGSSTPTRRPRKPKPATPRSTVHATIRARAREAHVALLRAAVPHAAAAEALATEREASADNDLVFQITWSGGTAALDHLTYNGLVVEETPTYGGGRLSVQFARPREPTHEFEWTLLFPGRTLQKLEAKATVDGGSASTLASKDSADSRWPATGSC